MKKTLVKDTFREVRKSLGRFFSIFAIVAIGVAFFTGIKSSSLVMKNTADSYYDDYNLMDFRVLSTLGLTEDDISKIRKVDGVKGVYPTHSIDVLTSIKSDEYVLKVFGLPINNISDSNENYINRVNLVEGRLPEKSGECVVEEGNFLAFSLKVGDKIKLSTGKDEDISKYLKNEEYTVVGKVETPYYLSYEKGTSDIGSGKVNSFIMISEDDFNMEVYTEALVTVKGAKELNSYDDEYFEVTDKVKEKLESLGETQGEVRIDDLKKQALEKLNEGKSEYEKNKKLYEDKIKEAEEKIASGKNQLTTGEKELENKKNEFNTFIEQSEKALSEGENQILQGEEQYKKAVEEYEKSKKQYETIRSQYDSIKTEYDKAREDFESKKEEANKNIDSFEEQLKGPKENVKQLKEELQSLYNSLENEDLTDIERKIINSKIKLKETKLKTIEVTLSYLESKIEKERNKILLAEKVYQVVENQFVNIENALNSGKEQLSQGESKLNLAKETLENSKTQLQEKKAELENGKVTGENELKKAEEKLTLGKEEIKKAEEELEKSKKYGQEQLDKALEEIKRGEEKINSIEAPSWYVLDRKLHYSYMDYGNAADKMNSIAKVFPVFFFLVAALVCLTTMTRMVDEQRGEIGTLKALGYDKKDIVLKFIIYAFIASILGGILGVFIGSLLFPTVIYNAWAIMYVMPSVKLIFDWKLALLAIIIATLITTLAALISCYKELVATPSVLMRPLPPKNGKRIFLEKVTFIWKRLSFTKKVTARNLFRYKKRFFMTVIGISGCTALLLIGYGIKDSIKAIADIQYGDIIKSQCNITLSDDSTIEERKKALEEIKNNDGIDSALDVEYKNTTLKDGNSEVSISLVVPSDVEKFKEQVCIRERKSKTLLDLNEKEVIISEKLSKNLGIKEGDKINITIGDGYYDEVVVGGIMEMYVGHYVVMSPNYYKETFKVTPDYNAVFALTKDKNTSSEKELGKEIMSIDNVKSINFYSSMLKTFNDTISSLNFVVAVLIISAAALAFVVLYNLTNINVSERIREIATIKVLGFYDNEVAAYVYRENMLLTLIGSIVGLALGVLLHRFIMSTIEFDNVMFGRNIDFLSYIYSILLTLGFGLLVNLVMYFRLKKIPMVESLKSVE